jgi:hypothetical protein
MPYKWTPVFGDWEILDEATESGVLHGREIPWVDRQQVEHRDGYMSGLALCNAKFFGGGTVSTRIRFADRSNAPATGAGIVIWSGNNGHSHLDCGFNLGSTAMYAVRGWNGSTWIDYDAKFGVAENIRTNYDYDISVTVSGSSVRLVADGINVVSAEIPFRFQPGPVGVYGFAKHDVFFSNFKVKPKRAKAFVVMQFSAPYNELHAQVIKPICAEFSLDAERGDDTFGPGIIIQDIVRQMLACDVVIAEITPTNANVYYELGYAHALKKPCILIAEKGTELPFDVSPFRVLMYENSIDGKHRVEEGLRNHLTAIFAESQSLP